MSKVCPICRSINCIVEAGRFGDGSPSFTCLHCHTDIRKERILPVTVFDRITQSPEVLAPYCISTKPSINGDTLYYYSTVTGHIYSTETDAIAATAAKLKEVCDE